MAAEPSMQLSPIVEEDRTGLSVAPHLAVKVQLRIPGPDPQPVHSRQYVSSAGFQPTERHCRELLRRIEHSCEELVTRKDSLSLQHRDARRHRKSLRYEISFTISRQPGGLWAERTFRSYQRQPLTAEFAAEIVRSTHRVVGLFLKHHDKAFRWTKDPATLRCFDRLASMPLSLGDPVALSCIPLPRFVEATQSYQSAPGYGIELQFTSCCRARRQYQMAKTLMVKSGQDAPLTLTHAEGLLWDVHRLVDSRLDRRKVSLDQEHQECDWPDTPGPSPNAGECGHFEEHDAVVIDLRIKNSLGPAHEHLHRHISTKLVLFRQAEGEDCLEFLHDVERGMAQARDEADAQLARMNDLELRIVELRGPGWFAERPARFRLDGTSSRSRHSIEAILDRVQTGIGEVLSGRNARIRITALKRGHLILDKTLIAGSLSPGPGTADYRQNSQTEMADALASLKRRIQEDLDRIEGTSMYIGGLPEDDVPLRQRPPLRLSSPSYPHVEMRQTAMLATERGLHPERTSVISSVGGCSDWMPSSRSSMRCPCTPTSLPLQSGDRHQMTTHVLGRPQRVFPLVPASFSLTDFQTGLLNVEPREGQGVPLDLESSLTLEEARDQDSFTVASSAAGETPIGGLWPALTVVSTSSASPERATSEQSDLPEAKSRTDAEPQRAEGKPQLRPLGLAKVQEPEPKTMTTPVRLGTPTGGRLALADGPPLPHDDEESVPSTPGLSFGGDPSPRGSVLMTPPYQFDLPPIPQELLDSPSLGRRAFALCTPHDRLPPTDMPSFKAGAAQGQAPIEWAAAPLDPSPAYELPGSSTFDEKPASSDGQVPSDADNHCAQAGIGDARRYAVVAETQIVSEHLSGCLEQKPERLAANIEDAPAAVASRSPTPQPDGLGGSSPEQEADEAPPSLAEPSPSPTHAPQAAVLPCTVVDADTSTTSPAVDTTPLSIPDDRQDPPPPPRFASNESTLVAVADKQGSPAGSVKDWPLPSSDETSPAVDEGDEIQTPRATVDLAVLSSLPGEPEEEGHDASHTQQPNHERPSTPPPFPSLTPRDSVSSWEDYSSSLCTRDSVDTTQSVAAELHNKFEPQRPATSGGWMRPKSTAGYLGLFDNESKRAHESDLKSALVGSLRFDELDRTPRRGSLPQTRPMSSCTDSTIRLPSRGKAGSPSSPNASVPSSPKLMSTRLHLRKRANSAARLTRPKIAPAGSSSSPWPHKRTKSASAATELAMKGGQAADNVDTEHDGKGGLTRAAMLFTGMFMASRFLQKG